MFLKRSITNSTSEINSNRKKCVDKPSSSSKSVQNLVSFVRNHNRYSFSPSSKAYSVSPVAICLTSTNSKNIIDLDTKHDREKLNVLKVNFVL